MAPRLNRSQHLAQLETDNQFDVVIIGGGIAGAATFRELTHQGLRVALIERGDFASGASGALTRVAQGGFRYLERGELKLVSKAVRDRNSFLANAPHQVRPLKVVVPTESWSAGFLAAPLRFLRILGGKSLPGALPVWLGVRLYEYLSLRSSRKVGRLAGPQLPKGGLMDAEELARTYPGISTAFRAAAFEFEGLITSPERIAIELLEDGLFASPTSVVLNHIEAVDAQDDAVQAVNRLSNDAPLTLRGRVVVNAAGALVDGVLGRVGISTKLVSGVAGTHLVLDAPEIAKSLGNDLLYFEDATLKRSKRRLCCLYAVGESVLMGATEVPTDQPDLARPEPAEETYLLAALNRLFPSSLVTERQIIRRMHGVRPLLHDSGDVNGRSRDHAIHVTKETRFNGAVVSVLGGKWTTFQSIAEDAANRVLAELGRDRVVETRGLPIGGGRGLLPDGKRRSRHIGELAASHGLSIELVARLYQRYGSRVDRVVAYISREPGSSTIPGISKGERRFLFEEEMANSDDDIFYRRTDLFLRPSRF